MAINGHWETVQAQARSWPIYLRYYGWDLRNCAVFHSQEILNLDREQITLLGGQPLPRWIQQWWPVVPGVFIGLLLGFIAPADAGREIIVGHGWANRLIFGSILAVVVSVVLCVGVLPRRWYNHVYGLPIILSRRVDPATGLRKIWQIGRCPLPKLGFIASRQDVYRGGTRHSGIVDSTPVLDAGEQDLRDLKPADLWDLPPAKGNYDGTNSRHARSLMEISNKAGLLYLDIHTKKSLLTGKNVTLVLLVVLACVAALNIMAGGGGIDVNQFQSQLSGFTSGQ